MTGASNDLHNARTRSHAALRRVSTSTRQTTLVQLYYVIYTVSQKKTSPFLRATAGTAIARLSHRNSVCLSVCPSVHLSVCHTGGSGKNGAS